MKGITLFCSLLGLFALNRAQIVQTGQCDDNIQLVTDFNVDQFMGTWYEVARTPSNTLTADCSSIELNNGANGIISFYNSAVNKNFFEEFTGVATQGAGAIFTVTFDGLNTSSEFWILRTDYTNYALAYRCENLGTTQRSVYIWQLSRTSAPLSAEIQTLTSTTLQSTLNINPNDLRSIQHTENSCLRLPVLALNEPVIFTGQCDPNIQVVQNFDVAQFLGQWHEIASYYSDSALGTCSRAQYSLVGNAVEVVNSQVINQALFTISGTASVASTDQSGVLNVELNVLPGVIAQQTLYIIATDYNNYAISYSCENVTDSTKRVFSWIIGRSPTLSPEAASAVDQIIESNVDLNWAYYEDTPRSADDCFYFPEPDSSQSVVFRGQCNENIPAMENFDPVRYTGLWHDIESYPSEFQGGSCNNAFYTLRDGVVDVYNTQVINQTLDTIDGLAVIDPEANGTGKLLVTFPIAGTTFNITTSYWILSTDYESYSLVYSCTNLDEDSRLVFGWKLSRTKQLPAAAITAINNVVATIDVLDQMYFVARDHTEDGCFYFPEPQAGVPVVFPGQCDQNLGVVNNFNLQQFSGVWNEIEAYPKEQQQGQCINHQFNQTSGTVLSFINNQVIDQLLQTNEGSVVTADGSGRLELTISVNNQIIVIPYWVIATDYTDYALIYSCLDIDSNFRGVWSWKLSRTKTLSAAANTAINNAITSVPVLDNQYYETIPQTDSACFYFPELNPSESVVFRGQCDETISAVENFDPVRYMGLWHDIESYPSEFQGGSCNNAFYTLRDGVVDVYNTQVVNQTLDTINGLAVIDPEANGSGKLLVTFPIAGTNFNITTNYWILSTDYDNYSLVYSCTNLDADSRLVFGWKLSRTKQLSAAATTTINNVVATIDVLDQRYFVARDQTEDGCFYFPEPQAGVPVVFPGQCNQNLNVVNNFDLQQFAGVWNEIEAYPKEQQQGQCINHQFSQTSANTLSFINNQVIDQLLQTNEGSVVTPDGSGRLELTIFVNNQTIVMPFWVIATDYTDYALIYSCLDIDSDFRGVWSWKLSRTRSLSAAANTAINNAIAPIEVLDNQYYETIPQTDTACFYYPDQSVVFSGQCDETIPAVENFDPVRYMGLWHDIESYPSEFQGGTCNNAFYTLRDGVVDVYNTQVIDGTLDTINGLAVIDPEANGTGKLLVTFPVAGTDFNITTSYWILSTDYDSYSLVYSCTNLDENSRLVFGWKLSRTKQLSAAASTAINNVMAPIDVLDQRYFVARDQTEDGCFYFPEPQAGVPVVFPGQCNQNLNVVNNFDLQQFAGVWNEIEAYPKEQQQGQCINHQFSQTSANTLSFINNQIIDQLLQTNEGSVVTADGSGRLELTIFVNNQTIEIPFWVIATDYTDYALIYSCLDIDSDFRGVWSWKLSRTRSLSAAANTAINNAIAPIEVLDNRYYETIPQTDSACFYFPEQGSVFSGQCDETIPAVENFDPVRYMGLWHDIESYPSEFQGGTCNNAFYTLRGSVVDVYNTQVINETLDTIDGLAVIDPEANGTGKLLVTFPVAGTDFTVTTNYWILSTDYDSYSLVYSCTNLDENSRLVFGWKLSRTKQLSAAASTVINNVMAPIDVLDQRYFVARDQTEDGCFYFPEPQAGVPVVFPGQCNQNLNVVNNFDLQQFAGVWNEIEAYPKEQQQGQCINHQFSQTSANTLSFINNQVFFEQLQTNEGSVVTADGSGRLELTIFVNNQTIVMPFWVIATDYTDYALVYSCLDIDSNFKGVWSWKLSRTRTLSAAASTAINNAISSILVLDDRYYVPILQTDVACFYYPEPVPGEAVTFRGQCDPDVAVVQNFDVARYLGLWYDIEHYPQGFQRGSCATAQYSLGQNGVDVYNTEVVNQQLSTINGTAVVASTDGSAKLTVTFPVEAVPGLTIDSPYWVLATDYDSYSLVYACTNTDEDNYRVTVWKLSRTQSLTANANAVINNIMTQVPVIRQQYFEETGHSEADCRTYPDNFGGPVFLDGQCPAANEVDVVTNFNAASFAGLWHEAARYPSEMQTGECGSTTLQTSAANSFTITQANVVNERLIQASGAGTVSGDGRGVITAELTNPSTGASSTLTLYVLATNYDDYALVYSCSNMNTTSKQIYSWKLSRSRDGLSPAANEAISVQVLNNVDLFEGYYEDVDQSNDACFYYPEFETLPETIELPGPCDSTIRGIPNFSAADYLGLWYEMASYPQLFQNGDCSRAEYSLGPDGVIVFNTQVINQTLDIMTGLAVVASDDGTGELSVTFVVQGVTNVANYYILATDYTDYAIVYSCRNLTNGNSQVSSWKLSRTKTLSAQANTVMDSVVESIRGLSENYYTTTSQSDEACFYVPELNENEVPEFRGTCDENITGVQNFMIESYIGWWHEVERYPSDNSAQCSSSVFQVADSGYEVVDTTVSGGVGTYTTVPIVASNDGRLRRTYSDGRVVDTWVLDTDYETYSLLYSCENIIRNGEEYRRVWSAKHSKERSLTNAAQNAMAPIIADNPVLVSTFYQQVDQSNQACFHYPEQTGQQIILPGQCDDNIPVMMNFDVIAYSGTWYQIEKYPQIHEIGECTGARYALDESAGVVTVLNWEVVDGVLDTIEGTAVPTYDDTSARLTVTLPDRSGTSDSGTVTFPLYVLTTDYVSYSLAYSCVNVNDFQRAIGAWKLSRQRTMPDGGDTAITSHMTTREELHQPYFLQVAHSEDCPEPSGGFIAKSSAIVILVCALMQLFF